MTSSSLPFLPSPVNAVLNSPTARYGVAAVLVRFSDEGARVALVLAGAQNGSPALSGLLVAALLVPHVVAAPGVGLVTDRARHPHRWLAGAAVVFGLALASAAAGLGHVPDLVVVVALLVGGCCGPALTGGLSSRIPTLVNKTGSEIGTKTETTTKTATARAFGLGSLTYNVCGIAGPALVGICAALTSPRLALGLLALACVLGAALVFTLPERTGPTTEPTAAPRAAARTGAHLPASSGAVTDAMTVEMTGGIRALLDQPTLAAVTLASSIAQLGLGALPVIAVVLTSRADAPQAVAWMLSANAVGALLGSLAWAWQPAPPSRAARWCLLSLLGVGLPLVLAALTPSPVPAAALFALSGLFTGPFTGALFTTRDLYAPRGTRAQIFTLGAGIKVSSAAAGAALAGLLTNQDTATLLLGAGTLPLLAAAAGAALRLRDPDRCPRE